MATESKADSLQIKLTKRHHHEIQPFLKDLRKDQLISLGTALGLDFNKLRNKVETDHLLGDLISGWLKMEDYVKQVSGIPRWASLIKALEDEGHQGIADNIRESKIQGLPISDDADTGSSHAGSFVDSTQSHQIQSGYTTSQTRDETTSLSPRAGEKRQRCFERIPADEDIDEAARKVAKYQHLNIENLTEEERDRFIGQLEVDSEQIRIKFAGLLHDTGESLTRNKIQMERLILLLDSFNIPEISQCRTINEVLIKTKPYRSFFNYGIIELLIEKIGDDHDKARLKAYKLEFEKYCKRRLCEVPTDAFKSDSTALARVCVKTDKTFEVPLEDIKSVTARLSHLLNIPLILLKIKEGCVELEIDCLRKDNFLLFQSDNHADTFLQIGITKIYNDNEVLFECENKKIDVQRSGVLDLHESVHPCMQEVSEADDIDIASHDLSPGIDGLHLQIQHLKEVIKAKDSIIQSKEEMIKTKDEEFERIIQEKDDRAIQAKNRDIRTFQVNTEHQIQFPKEVSDDDNTGSPHTGGFVDGTQSHQIQSGYPTSQARDETTSLSPRAGEKRQRCFERIPADEDIDKAARKVTKYQHLSIENLTEEQRYIFIRRKATVLLIGSTGNGKSSLGNFLFNPFDEQKLSDREKQYFRTSTDLQPHTNETKAVCENVSYSSYSGNLTVIDTPGLNDVKDFKNMCYLMKKLQDLKEINTCIVVVKLDGKIDVPYKETLKYYSELLPNLFKKNLIVVVTHYFQDEASIIRRKRGKIDEEVNKCDILDAVRATCGLPANPMLFMIDSLPVKGDNISLSVRNEILDYVFKQEPYTIPQFKVAKTSSIKQQDKTKYDQLVQEATEQSHQTYSKNPDLQEEIDVMDGAITDLKVDKKQWEMKRDDLDTEELVDYTSWKTRKRWRLFKTPSDYYDLSTHPYKIRNIIKDGSSEVHWRNEERTDCTLSGRVKGEENHGYIASIILQVYKRDKYEKEIMDCKKEIEVKESHLIKKMNDRENLKKNHELIFKRKVTN